MTKSAARELASRGITVNAVAPGFIQTDMTDSLSDKIKDACIALFLWGGLAERMKWPVRYAFWLPKLPIT